MGTWILIITSLWNGVAVDHMEFNSQTACENAAKILKNKIYGTNSAVCVPK